MFEVRIYPIEYSVPNILSVCRNSPEKTLSSVDLPKLERIVDGINYNEVRKKKAIYSRLYHEAIVSHEPGLGISFTDMLTLLAHHKLIVDAEALVWVSDAISQTMILTKPHLNSLHDLVARTETNKLVTDLVNLDRVRSLLKTISHRRRFLKYLENKQRAEKYDKGRLVWYYVLVHWLSSITEIPSIIVEDMPGTPPLSSRDISTAGLEEGSPGSPTLAFRASQGDYPISLDISTGPRLQRGRRISDHSTYSLDPRSRYSGSNIYNH